MVDKTLVLNGRSFTCGVIPPVEAIHVEIAVAKVIGEPLFKAFMEEKPSASEGGAEKDDAEKVGAIALTLMLSKMEPETVVQTMATVFKYVSCDGQRVDIDATFVGRNREVWQVFVHALRFNFADFLPEGLFASVKKAKAK